MEKRFHSRRGARSEGSVPCVLYNAGFACQYFRGFGSQSRLGLSLSGRGKDYVLARSGSRLPSCVQTARVARVVAPDSAAHAGGAGVAPGLAAAPLGPSAPLLEIPLFRFLRLGFYVFPARKWLTPLESPICPLSQTRPQRHGCGSGWRGHSSALPTPECVIRPVSVLREGQWKLTLNHACNAVNFSFYP